MDTGAEGEATKAKAHAVEHDGVPRGEPLGLHEQQAHVGRDDDEQGRQGENQSVLHERLLLSELRTREIWTSG